MTMSRLVRSALLSMFVLMLHRAEAQTPQLTVPETVQAGNRLQISTSGSGPATIYIAGPGGALSKAVQLGSTLVLEPNDVHNAGRYIAALVTKNGSTFGQFTVTSAREVSSINFIAKPSRLPVRLQGGVSGVAYLLDPFGNLVLQNEDVTFVLTDLNGTPQSRKVTSKLGVAWTRMNSVSKAGLATFEASVQNVREKRVIQEVAGDPCTLRMTARPSSWKRVSLETEPVKDCSGNPVPDGTIVTFTQTYGSEQSTVDVPLKRGIAKAEMPARSGSIISVASGVVMGNEIRLGGGM